MIILLRAGLSTNKFGCLTFSVPRRIKTRRIRDRLNNLIYNEKRLTYKQKLNDQNIRKYVKKTKQLISR